MPELVLLEPTTTVAGVRVASMRDILAMKLKALGDRAEMRDYFDLMLTEEEGDLSVENGLDSAVEKFHPPDVLGFRAHILRCLRTSHDVTEDPTLPVDPSAITKYWARRAKPLPRY